jgi:hypothetical protein
LGYTFEARFGRGGLASGAAKSLPASKVTCGESESESGSESKSESASESESESESERLRETKWEQESESVRVRVTTRRHSPLFTLTSGGAGGRAESHSKKARNGSQSMMRRTRSSGVCSATCHVVVGVEREELAAPGASAGTTAVHCVMPTETLRISREKGS